jgi:hypothetical protein
MVTLVDSGEGTLSDLLADNVGFNLIVVGAACPVPFRERGGGGDGRHRGRHWRWNTWRCSVVEGREA